MCGIAGFYSLNDLPAKQQLLEAMTRSLQHRGPDAEGYFLSGPCGFGHRRLSIIDVSENGNQPMYAHNNRYVMVYNGEVYNYREIAKELTATFGTKFQSTSDSEVILEAFSNWGI